MCDMHKQSWTRLLCCRIFGEQYNVFKMIWEQIIGLQKENTKIWQEVRYARMDQELVIDLAKRVEALEKLRDEQAKALAAVQSGLEKANATGSTFLLEKIATVDTKAPENACRHVCHHACRHTCACTSSYMSPCMASLHMSSCMSE